VTGTPKQSRREERRQEQERRLLDAVEQVLKDGESYTDVSIARLSRAAGVSRPTFYAYFPTKGDLLRARFAEIVAELHAATASWWALGPDPTREQVRAALARIVVTSRPHARLMAAISAQAAYDEDVRHVAAAMMAKGIGDLQAHIERGHAEGFVDPALPAAETAAWLMWMGERAHNQLLSTASRREVDRHIDAYTDIVFKTLYTF
jgi:AcrR family transcriptional regulator